MSKATWLEIARRVDDHAYMSGVERTVARVAGSGEIFTPTALVIEMLRTQPLSTFGPGKTVFDPACGDGQFLVAVKWTKVLALGMSEEVALQDIYGVDIMRDNVDICKRRLGGGTILMGNTLQPALHLPGQTLHEHQTVLTLLTGLNPLFLL